MITFVAAAVLMQGGASRFDPNIDAVLPDVRTLVRENNATVPSLEKFCMESRVSAIKYGSGGQGFSLTQGPTMAKGEIHIYTSFNFSDPAAPRMEQRVCEATGVDRQENVVHRIVGDGAKLVILDLKAATRQVVEYGDAERPAEKMIRAYVGATPLVTILAKRFVANAYLLEAWSPIVPEAKRLDLLAPALGYGNGHPGMASLRVSAPAPAVTRGLLQTEQIHFSGGNGGILHIAYLHNLKEGHTLTTMPNMESPNVSYVE